MKLLALSGFIPEQINDVIRFTGYSGTQNISHYCGYVSDFISQILEDNNIDGCVFPRSCDSSRVIKSYLEPCNKFVYQTIVPARKDEMAIQLLAQNIKDYKEALEKHYDIEITNINDRILKINERNSQLRAIYENIDKISYYSYLDSIHRMLTCPLFEQKSPTFSFIEGRTGKKVYLVGSFLSNIELIKHIEQSGLIIAGDNITESKRLFSVPDVSISGNIYVNIASSILNNSLSPTQNDFESIILTDLKEIKEKNIHGVIYVTQKYCEPYNYMYSAYKKMLDQNNIPVLKIDLTSSIKDKISKSVIEAFADIL